MKDRERTRRVKELFQAASRLEGDERADYLRDIATETPDLIADVERLLAAERQVDDAPFLDPPGLNLRTLIGDGSADSNVGRRIGPYELHELIGAGGMGSVYLAVRRDEYEQRVAIKLVKRGMDTDEVIRRFRYERQTLAGLNHPNIARILDGGTDEGLPFFVMNYIEGVPIDDYCDRHELTIRARLELFKTVCDAVAHAHANIVVHRDLKPANILVTRDGVPKLLDFGLARLLSPEIGFSRIDPTRAQERFVTASYASPEQLQGDTVGKPSDVYSLGIILYELLAGRRPFDLAGLPAREIERIVTFERPPPPSTLVRRTFVRRRRDGTVEETTPDVVSRERSTNPDELARLLNRDLDSIARMALRKEPSDRYPDARALSEDLGRWLRDEPIQAHRESVSYVTRLFVRRHRLLVTATTAVVVALSAGLVTSLGFMAYAFEQRDAAVEARAVAKDESRRSLSKKLAGQVLLGAVEDPQLRLLLAMEAVNQSRTPVAEYALRRALADTKPGLVLGHDVGAARFAPNGERVLSVGQDGTARVWDAGSGDLRSRLLDPDGAIRSAVFDPEGARVVTSSTLGTARVWDVTRQEAELLFSMRHDPDPLLYASFSPDGQWIITTGEDGALRLWDAATGEESTVAMDLDGPLPRAVYSRDGRYIAVATSDGTGGRILDGKTHEELATIVGHRGIIRAASFSPTAEQLVTGSDDWTVRVWDTRTGRRLRVLHGHNGPVREVAFSPDGRWIITAGDDDTVRVWDAVTGELLRIEGGHGAAFSPDGAWLVVARSDDHARVLPWELFAPLEDNMEEARRRVTRELTPAERNEYLRELTPEEAEALLQKPIELP